MKKKLITVAVCCALLGGVYAVDYGISEQYEYELVHTTAETFVADGQSTVRITVRLTKGGTPVKGHTIYLYVSNGFLPASRCVTDEDGTITFRYYPYLYLNDKLTPLEDVTIYLQDESNSMIFMVPAKAEYTFPTVKPEEDAVREDWQDIKTGTEEGGS